MGSNSIDLLDLKLDTVADWEEPGKIFLKFTCPRCESINIISVTASDLLGDIDLECQNPYCGTGAFTFSMRLAGLGSATSTLSRPVGTGKGTLYRVNGEIRFLKGEKEIKRVTVNRVVEADNPDSAIASVVDAESPNDADGSDDWLKAKAIGPTLQGKEQ